MSGMKERRLISNPIHAPNQDVEETEIIVLPISVVINSSLAGFNCIKKEEVRTLISGV